MSQKINLTLGSDPEVFLYDEAQKQFIPALGLIKGTKEEPFEIIAPGFSTQVDNAMCEYNIAPSNTPQEFSDNIQKVYDWLKDNLPGNIQVKVLPSAEFTPEALDNEQCQLLGCSADYDVYSGENTSVTSLSQTNWRFAGGHIHVGYDKPNTLSNEQLVKWMDIYLGLPSVILDEDDRRKQYYGTPGRHRAKDFGVEYRTLSNWWTENETFRKFIFTQTQKAYYALVNEVSIGEEYERQVRDCILSNNREEAQRLMTHFNVVTNEKFSNLINIKVYDNTTAHA